MKKSTKDIAKSKKKTISAGSASRFTTSIFGNMGSASFVPFPAACGEGFGGADDLYLAGVKIAIFLAARKCSSPLPPLLFPPSFLPLFFPYLILLSHPFFLFLTLKKGYFL
jgi:hypothetical protein